MRKNPFSVVLFDEVEKAHPEVVTNILLQLMDEGVLSDMSTGALVDGSNALIMMTSNLGNRQILQRKMGFGREIKENLNAQKQYKEHILDAVRDFFPPEFLGRLDEIILFNCLTPEVRKKIFGKAIRDLEDKINRTLKAPIIVNVSDKAISLFLEEAEKNKEAGARAVLRVIERIEEQCAEMFSCQLKEGVAQSINVDVDAIGKIVLTVENP